MICASLPVPDCSTWAVPQSDAFCSILKSADTNNRAFSAKARRLLTQSRRIHHWRRLMTLGTILLIIVILLLIGAIPSWPYSRSWGYAPSGGLGLVLIILLVL